MQKRKKKNQVRSISSFVLTNVLFDKSIFQRKNLRQQAHLDVVVAGMKKRKKLKKQQVKRKKKNPKKKKNLQPVVVVVLVVGNDQRETNLSIFFTTLFDSLLNSVRVLIYWSGLCKFLCSSCLFFFRINSACYKPKRRIEFLSASVYISVMIISIRLIIKKMM